LKISGGNGGKVAKMIGAVFGAEHITDTDFIAAARYYIDNGITYEDLIANALSIAGANSSE